ncbi:hypothetical protein HCJ99_34050, partial [Streptomyces sp. C1-2]|nr:hypothetical protein [Streptomyces sp. C1-2]
VTEGGRKVEVQGRIERTDAGLITDPNAVNLAAVPNDLIPPRLQTYAGTCSMAGATTDGTGRVEVIGANTSSAYGSPG